MKICTQCNFQNTDNALFCRQCGAKLSEQTPYAFPVTPPPTGQPVQNNFTPQQSPYAAPVQSAASQPQKKKKGCLTAFLIVVGIAFLLCVIFFCVGFFSTDQNNSTKNDISNQQRTESGALGDYYIVVKDWTIVKEYDDDVLVVTYSFANYSSSPASFLYSITARAFQQGIECPQEYYLFEGDTFDFEAEEKAVQPGYFLDVPCAYKLSNLSTPVVIELERSFSISSEKVSYTIDITEQ